MELFLQVVACLSMNNEVIRPVLSKMQTFIQTSCSLVLKFCKRQEYNEPHAMQPDSSQPSSSHCQV